MTRTPIMAGNWKMNLNHIDAVGLVQKLAWTLADEGYDRRKCEAVVVPPFTDIRSVQTLIEGDKLPLKHFLVLVRGILLKGIGIGELWPAVWPIVAFMVVVTGIGLVFYRRTLD